MTKSFFDNEEERTAFEDKLKDIASKHYEKMPNGLFRLKEEPPPKPNGSLEDNLKNLVAENRGTPDHVACQAVNNQNFMTQLKSLVKRLSGTTQFYTIASGSMSAVLGTGRDSNGIDHVIHITRVDPHSFMLNRPDSFMLQPYPCKSSFRNGEVIKGKNFYYYVDVVPKVITIRELANIGELSSNVQKTGLDELSIIENSMLISSFNADFYGTEVDSKNTCLLPNGLIIPCDPNSLSKRDKNDNYSALEQYKDKLLLEIPAKIDQSAFFSYDIGKFQSNSKNYR